MLKYYFKLGYRNICKHKKVTLINIVCLSVGIAILLLISVYAKNELSVDDFHLKKSQIYKVSYGKSSSTPGPLSRLLATEFPEIEDATHIETRQVLASSPVLNYNNNAYEIEQYYIADSSFFNLFNFEELYGDVTKSLVTPLTLILTKSEALRIFKNENPVGETVTWKSAYDFTYTVGAVVKDLPKNSSIRFNGLISEVSLKNMGNDSYSENWGYTVFETYLLLKPNINPILLEEKMKSFLIAYYKTNLSSRACSTDAQTTPLKLHSLEDVYFDQDLTYDTTNRGNLLLVQIMIIIGIVIMLLSIINYINLSTASASLRTKEIGIRKVIGSNNQNLILQHMSKTLFISFIAAIIGFIIAIIFLNSFSQFMNIDLKKQLYDYTILLLFIPGILVVGFLAGIYPAFITSTQSTIEILKKGTLQKNKGVNLRYTLIVFQFAVSITLIASTIIIGKQIKYLDNKNLGFNDEQVIYAKLPQIMRDKKEPFRKRIKELPNVKEVAFSSSVIGQIEGLNSQVINGKTFNFASLWVDPEFIDLYGLNIIKGRSFSKEFRSDINSTLLLNETALINLGAIDPFQIEMRIPGGRAKVVGIVKDFNFKSLHNNIEPMAIVYLPRQGQYVNIKLSGKEISSSLKEIGTIWNEFSPGFPFNYQFLDSSFDKLYDNEVRMGKAFTFFSFIAIIISIWGIVSLSVLVCQNREKEIGVRKINGATILEILTLLNRDFVRLLFIAFVISCPIAYYAMHFWLKNFAYKTGLSWWIFALAGSLALGIEMITVSWQCWRAAARNPVEVLRCD